jgi:amino acid permease
MRKNVPIVGFIIGILLPILGFAILYFLWFKGRDVGAVLSSMAHDHKMAGKVLTMSLLINLVPFVYCNTKRLDYAMKGIVIATMLYAVLIVLVMFVW